MDNSYNKYEEGLTPRDSFNSLMERTDLPLPIKISDNGKYINQMEDLGIDFDPVDMLMFFKITLGLNNGELSKEEFNQLKSR